MKSPVILRIFKDSQLVEVKQFDSEQIIFGNGAEVEVNLPDETVSAIHCLIELRDSGYYIADLGSARGTFKNDRPVLDELISSGDQIGIGAYSVHFFVGVPKPKAPPPGAKPAAPPTPVAPPKPTVAAVPPAAPSAPTNNNRDAVVAPPPKLPDSTKETPPTAPRRDSPPPKPASPGMPKSAKVPKPAHSKNWGTFAPASDYSDLRTQLRPGKGSIVQVVVAWRERALQTYHFGAGKNVTIGSNPTSDVQIPSGFGAEKAMFLEMSGGVRIQTQASWEASVVTGTETKDAEDLAAMGRLAKSGSGTLKLEQNELACFVVGDGSLQLFVRFIPAPGVVPMAGLDLSGSELTSMFVSLILVAFLALYMSVYAPSDKAEDKPEDQLHLATFVYNKPPPRPETPPPPQPQPKPEVKVEEKPKPIPPPQPKPKVVVAEKQPEKTKGNPDKPVAQKTSVAAKAAEVRANPNNMNKPKKMTSVKSGGAIKFSNSDSANAQSAKDVTKTGLLSAFGNAGVRKNLDQAYSGSGEALGVAGAAKGTSGQNSDRNGDDPGSRFKDSGAGGKGTQTEGIAGVGTKGRSSGQSAYGNVGVGGKGSVAVNAGGADAEFTGTVDREAVRRVIRNNLNQIRSCYERSLRSNSDLEGKIFIHWEVSEQGHVRIANVKDAPQEMRAVAECVAGRIKEFRFPEPPAGSIYEVDFPFAFGRQQ